VAYYILNKPRAHPPLKKNVIMYPLLVALVKATFLRYFLQHSQFNTSEQDITPGTLVNVGSDLESGFLPFLRLVGVAYTKKHGCEFGGKSPEADYIRFTFSGQSTLYQPDVVHLLFSLC